MVGVVFGFACEAAIAKQCLTSSRRRECITVKSYTTTKAQG